MREETRLANIRQPFSVRPKEATRLGCVVGELIEQEILPRHKKFGQVADVWCQLIEPELGRHCTLAGIYHGQLRVLVDSPSYLYQVRMLSSELLPELQRHCRWAGIKMIKAIIGSSGDGSNARA